MVERLYGTATPTASTDPAMSAPPTKPQPTCCPATAASSTRPLHGKDGVAGSIPAGGSTQALTSANADHLRVRGRWAGQ
jgi:hypothetical protein